MRIQNKGESRTRVVYNCPPEMTQCRVRLNKMKSQESSRKFNAKISEYGSTL